MGILKKKTEVQPEAYKPEVVEAPKAVGCEAPIDGKPCGKPLADGQTYVCRDHVRAG